MYLVELISLYLDYSHLKYLSTLEHFPRPFSVKRPDEENGSRIERYLRCE